MSVKKITGLLMVMLAVVSCKKELEPQDSSTSTDTTAVAATENTLNPTAPTVTPGAQPVQIQPNAAPVVNTAAPAAVAKGMNPAHGQPGHRCDIAVGAPLNSPPGKPGAQAKPVTMGSTPGQATIVPTPAPAGTPAILNAPTAETAPGMNPPHGQPGHKCDVAVGAPLPK